MQQIQQVIDTLIKLEGAVYCVLVNADNGALLASAGGEDWPLDVLAEASAKIVRADRQAMQVLGKKEEAAQELLFTDKDYLHAIIIVPKSPRFYLCTGLDRKRGSLALVHRVAQNVLADLVINL